ncbi:hypothetical protein KUTeg_009576 [Tegillarca granosa]|uniref:Uncharacterized protein n=1 Tax=Tegillarca granosa TaxID=220873 RepID=A0ABQ9F4A6_TEGGR|nr:hypothetical protein KUTeg_009576 [Tegillarca granosa]
MKKIAVESIIIRVPSSFQSACSISFILKNPASRAIIDRILVYFVLKVSLHFYLKLMLMMFDIN